MSKAIECPNCGAINYWFICNGTCEECEADLMEYQEDYDSDGEDGID